MEGDDDVGHTHISDLVEYIFTMHLVVFSWFKGEVLLFLPGMVQGTVL